MDRKTGFKVAEAMRCRKTNPMRWAKDNGHSSRTVNEVLYSGMGERRGGEKTDAIFADLIDQGYIDGDHNFVEPERKAS